jgi:pyridoxine kinase
MARILAISSQVARGHVGLSAIVPALQALGHEVIALPTILLSNHPAHAHSAGEHVSPALLQRMLEALDANGWLAGLDAILTGYLPSAAHVTFAATAVARARVASPAAIYLCDAVLGDTPKGLYIAPDAAAALRDSLVATADIIKANTFELGWLAAGAATNAADAQHLVAAHGWRDVIVTSLPCGTMGRLANVWTGASRSPARVEVDERDGVPKGTGDLLAGLLLGHLLGAGGTTADIDRRAVLARSIADLQRNIEASLGCDELQLAPWLATLR